MNELLKQLLEGDCDDCCFSWETEAPKDGKKKTWTLTMTPDEDKEAGEMNQSAAEKTRAKDFFQNKKPDKASFFSIGDLDLGTPKAYRTEKKTEPENGKEIVRIAVTKGDVASATLINEPTGLTKPDRLNSMLVAFCREAATLMGLSFEDLFIALSKEVLSFVTTSTLNDFMDHLLESIELDDKE